MLHPLVLTILTHFYSTSSTFQAYADVAKAVLGPAVAIASFAESDAGSSEAVSSRKSSRESHQETKSTNPVT